MTLVIPTGYANVVHVFKDSSSTKLFTTAIGVSIPTGKTLGDIATDFGNYWVSELRDETFGTIQLLSVTAVDAINSIDVPRNAFGTISGPPGDLWSTVVVKKRTARKGQAHRGRMFFPGMLDDSQIERAGQVNEARVAELQTAFEAWAEAAGTDGYIAALFHNEDTPSGTTPDDITALLVSRNVGVQRRRRMR